MRRYQSSGLEVCDPACQPAGRVPGHALVARTEAWRNPRYELRVALTATAWALPGVLAGLLVEAVAQFTPDPASAALQGAALGGAVGAWLEARSRA